MTKILYVKSAVVIAEKSTFGRLDFSNLDEVTSFIINSSHDLKNLRLYFENLHERQIYINGRRDFFCCKI